MEWLLLIEKGFWFGIGAIGFAILFNVPPRTIFIIWLLAALGGLAKLFLIFAGASALLASLAGATLIGILSIQAAHNKHAPPLVFSIPAVIPLVPGVYAYQAILGLIILAGNSSVINYNEVLASTVNNGLNAIFILMSLAVGVSAPMLLTRKSSAKHMK
ncbi:MAG: threonine/serine exporter [Bacteroidales bacterium]|nr:threonine/serine exporter [Bacteroidales bacterium]